MKSVVAIVTSIALSLFASLAHAMTVDEVVSHYVDARGGAAKLHAITSARFTGTVRFGVGDFSLDATFAEIAKRDVGARIETTIQGITGVDVYDAKGSGGWKTEPWQGRRDASRMSGDDAKEMLE